MSASPKAFKSWSESELGRAIKEYHRAIAKHDLGLLKQTELEQVEEKLFDKALDCYKAEEDQPDTMQNIMLSSIYGLIVVLFLVLAYTVWFINSSQYTI